MYINVRLVHLPSLALVASLALGLALAPEPAKACGSHKAGIARSWDTAPSTSYSSGARNLAEMTQIANKIVACRCYLTSDGRDLQGELANAAEGVSASGSDALVRAAAKQNDRAAAAVQP
jgi:hypothetical protein